MSNIKQDVGNRIRQLRIQAGLSQEDLANICEIDRTYITSVECGRRNISIVNLEKIANGLNISLCEFFAYTKIRH